MNFEDFPKRMALSRAKKMTRLRQPYSGIAPYGLRWCGKSGHKKLALDLRKHPGEPLARPKIVEMVFRGFLQGNSVRGLTTALQDEGIHIIYSKLYRMLTDPRYIGKYYDTEAGEWKDGNFPAIISISDYNAVADKLLKNRR